MEIKLNPGHVFNLKEIGILKEDESGIEPGELVARTLSGRKVEEVLYVLEQDFGNRQMTFISLDFLIEDTQNSTKTGKKRKEEVQEMVDILGHSLYYATIQVELITTTADVMKEEVQGSETLSHLWTEKADKHWVSIHKVRDKTRGILKEKEETYRKSLKEFTSFLES